MRRNLAAVGWVLAAQVVLSAAVGDDHPRLDIKDGVLRLAVVRAAAGAARRLNDPRCEQVLNDFRDLSGQLLFENLKAMRLSPAQFMEAIWFIDGSHSPVCGPGVKAFTKPHSRQVYICGSEFVGRAGLIHQTFLEMILIHELLHSLGLGENGRHPTSAAISRRVMQRCSV